MNRTFLRAIALILGSYAAGSSLLAAERTPERRAFGIDQRTAWTTSHIVGTPDPLPPYEVEVVWPRLKFDQPLEITPVPGGARLCVLERLGKLYTFDANNPAAEPELLLDVGRTAYGVAFHPQFEENGYVYVVYILDPTVAEERGTRLVRYTLAQRDPLRLDPASETLLLEWISGGHNGGCIHFGPDGCLYVSTGDGSGIADEFQTGQDLGDLLGAMLRLDVDRTENGLNYAIPADNPFIGRAGARPEVWAYGLRQAWKFSFDRATGQMWFGEIGQDLWESVHLGHSGGNYGWSVVEGAHPFRPERPKGADPFVAPLLEIHHTSFRSITGGHVYRGQRLPELEGAYIYGDYDTGKIWALRSDGQSVTENFELEDTQLRIIDFLEDATGELFLLDFVSGQIYQLRPRAVRQQEQPFPRLLSETGLFASTVDLTLAPGVLPYSVNSQLWSDGAHKDRYLALPGDAQIQFDAVTYPQPAPGSTPGWKFPSGTVVVKTFYLDEEVGNAASRRRLETRLLVGEIVGGTEEYGDQVWRGYTYVWNDEQTDAELLGAEGADRMFMIKDPAAPGGVRQQTWHFPSRAECSTCHTVAAKYVLGLNTMQMNREHDYGGVVANQLATFEHLGLFTQSLPQPPEELPTLVDYNDETASVAQRARSYLHGNCSHCHRKWGGGNAEFQLLVTLPLDETGMLLTRPNHGAFGLPEAALLVPGKPEQSLIYHRMTRTGLGRMPHIASSVVDEQAVQLVGEWIRSLAP